MGQTTEMFLVVIIPAIITGIPAIISAIAARKTKAKIVAEAKAEDATAADKISASYQKIVDDLQQQIDAQNKRQKDESDWQKQETKELRERQEKMERKLDYQGKRIRILEQGVHRLINQVTELGAEPVFTLDDPPENVSKGE